ncbi:hypothetical protein [Pseudonocardia sp. TRM90224]|uniref:hypothetical protein n=1 Tax=Pseudonocardia sp. TRM90224 TaxID=2812678 RepID=UPI001E4C30AB|nr:hypothetical protein [Pseudonocardia sp. TRM90224]
MRGRAATWPDRALPPGLSRRAERLLATSAVWIDPADLVDIDAFREQWENDLGVPSEVIDRMKAFQAMWGGLILPPMPLDDSYDGGPRVLEATDPLWIDDLSRPGWWFDAGPARTALAATFVIGPDGTFGHEDDRVVPLHASIAGWVEAVALAYAAMERAETITRYSGDAVADVDLTGMEPVPETAGLADTWWYRPDTLVSIHTGCAELYTIPGSRTAHVYTGIGPRAL